MPGRVTRGYGAPSASTPARCELLAVGQIDVPVRGCVVAGGDHPEQAPQLVLRRLGQPGVVGMEIGAHPVSYGPPIRLRRGDRCGHG